MNKNKNKFIPQKYLLYFFFLLSGFSGLVYEIIWVRLLNLSFGNSMYAISIVLATFMGGLAIGAYVVGRYLGTHPRPLRLYALLELGIGLWALLVPVLLERVDRLHIFFHPILNSALADLLLHFGLSSLVLLIPTVLMGGTLPALTTHFTKHIREVGEKLTVLYTLNTLGAVIGVWWVSFFALQEWGINLTNFLAVLVNIIIGGFCLFLDSRLDKISVKPTIAEQQPFTASKMECRFLLCGVFVAGFAAMVYELAWTRSLIMVLGSSTYAFSCILMAFLLGITLGSEIHYWLRKKTLPTSFKFSLTQIFIAGSCLLTLLTFSLLPRAYLISYNLFSHSKWTIQLVRFLLPLSVMIIPTTMMGAAFLLAGEAYTRSTGHVSPGIGNIYGSNVLGNVCGALTGGLLLLNALGAQNTLKLAVLLNLSVGTVGVLLSKSKHKKLLTAGALTIGVLAVINPQWDRYLFDSGVAIYTNEFDYREQFEETRLRRNEMLYFKEGRNCVVTVYQQSDGNRFLRVNGKTDAGTSSGDKTTGLLLGWLPLFLHPSPQNALVIGMGGGVTARAVAQYDFIQQVDCVELEPAVVEAAKLFGPLNHNIHQNNKVDIIVEDGRQHIKLTSKFYDLIISEPSNPWIKGIGNLFSVDFYRLAQQKLKPKGIMCQWIHAYELSPRVLRMAVNSFRQAFKYCQLWFNPTGADVFLIGSQTPIIFDRDRIDQLMNYNEDIKQELKDDLAIDSPSSVLGYFLLNNEEVTKFTAGAEVNTDNHPLLEFLAPRFIFKNTSSLNCSIMRSFKNKIQPVNVVPSAWKTSPADYYYDLSRIYLKGGLSKIAFHYIKRSFKYGSNDDPRYYLVRGKICLEQGLFDQAIDDFIRSIELDAENYEPHNELAQLYQIQGNGPEAEAHFQRSLELAPQNNKLLFDYASFLLTQGKYPEALSVTRGLLSSKELRASQVWKLMGDIYYHMKNFHEARLAYEQSNQENPVNFDVIIKLGELDFIEGKTEKGLKRLSSPRILYALLSHRNLRVLGFISDGYTKLGQYDKAAEILIEMLKVVPDNYYIFDKLVSLPGKNEKDFF